MKSSVAFLALLLHYTAHTVASPIAGSFDDDDEDCYMEWVTVYGDALGTGSINSPIVDAPTGAHKPIMRHSISNTAAVSVEATMGSSVAADSMTTNAPVVEPAKAYVPWKQLSSSTVNSPDSTSAAPVAASSSPSASSAAASGSPTTASSLTPGKNPKLKAGISGFGGVTTQSGWTQFTSYISWYSDYSPNPADTDSVKGIGMLWGNGRQGPQDSSRLAVFTNTVAKATPAPDYMMGFYEPDWTPPDSSAIDPATAAADWARWLAPLARKSTKLGSPSLAKQMDENWLTPFSQAPQKPSWDFTCIHANKNSSALVREDVEYYYAKYGKPVWVAEFSCMNDLEWTLCADPVGFIAETVAFLQGSEMVVAYGYSNGDGLPDSWKLFEAGGGLSVNGKAYLKALEGVGERNLGLR